jgi:hypothetical protein
VSFLHHVWKVVAIVLGQGSAEDHEVEGVAAQSFLNCPAARGGSYVMTGFGHFGGLRVERMVVGLGVENLDR